jgi:hypothetical protein
LGGPPRGGGGGGGGHASRGLVVDINHGYSAPAGGQVELAAGRRVIQLRLGGFSYG